MDQTLLTSEHSHVSRVKEWGYLPDGKMTPYVRLWDCTVCGTESEVPFKDEGDESFDHSNCNIDPCFGCKARSIQMNAGDAKSAIISGGMTQKAWDKELDLYKQARSQGIQPDSTRTKDIQKAMDLSNEYGKAYDGGSSTRGIYDGSI